MRLDIVTPPFAGHLHPAIGIGLAAERHGDAVRILSTTSAAPTIRAAGLEAVGLLAGHEALVERIANPGYRVGANPVRLVRQLRANLSLSGLLADEARAAFLAQPPDCVLADFTLPIVGFEAAKLGIPWATTHESPTAIETPDGTPGNLGGWRRREGVVWRTRDRLGRGAIRAFKRGMLAAFRPVGTRFGLDAVYREDGTERLLSPELVVALGLEAFELPATFPAAVRFVGPVRWSPTADAPKPEPVDVLVTLGTQLPQEKERAARVTAEAARLLPHLRFHFSYGAPLERRFEGSAHPDDPPNLQRIASADYDRLGGYRVVVHHGGAGVLWACVLGGVPQVVRPVDYDQPDQAVRLERAGLAVRLRRLTGPGIARAVRAALASDPEPRRRFQRLAMESDGAAHTVLALHELVASGARARRP